jgi:hypothetical protein
MVESKNWMKEVFPSAEIHNHQICAFTGKKPGRRTYVLWFCKNHPWSGDYFFTKNDPKIEEISQGNNSYLTLPTEILESLLQQYPDQPFHCTRMDTYLTPGKSSSSERKFCCQAGMYEQRNDKGWKIFQNLLVARGQHYNTTYTLLVNEKEYRGKLEKCLIKCETHGITFNYSMQNLNGMTSCPCEKCRIDPNHRNVAVEIVKRRNAGRKGQITRHATEVKTKYGNRCALSHSTFELHHHHLDGVSFYESIALDWQHNGICLCGTVHRDYHHNFLPNFSLLKAEYTRYLTTNSDSIGDSELNDSNPDFGLDGAEVSRYTFLEYVKFLIHSIKNKTSYVRELNNLLIKNFQEKGNKETEVPGQITLQLLQQAMEEYCAEYKGNNWFHANSQSIPFANDTSLWQKVENSWN